MPGFKCPELPVSNCVAVTTKARNRCGAESPNALKRLARQMFSTWLNLRCYFRLTSCAVTVLVSGLAVKRITAVTLLSGRRLLDGPLPEGGVGDPPDGAALGTLDPPAGR